MTQVWHKKKIELSLGSVLVATIIILAALALAILSPGIFFLGEQSSTPSTLQTATSGSGSPAEPIGNTTTKPTETQKTIPDKLLTFDQFVEKMNTPEEARKYMAENFHYRHSLNFGVVSPELLLAEGGKGDYGSFAHFFASFLAAKGCWQWESARTEAFILQKNNEAVDDEEKPRVVVAYKDPRDGNNYYMVPEPPNFPIYKMGASTDIVGFEEQRLGRNILTQRHYSQSYC